MMIILKIRLNPISFRLQYTVQANLHFISAVCCLRLELETSFFERSQTWPSDVILLVWNKRYMLEIHGRVNGFNDQIKKYIGFDRKNILIILSLLGIANSTTYLEDDKMAKGSYMVGDGRTRQQACSRRDDWWKTYDASWTATSVTVLDTILLTGYKKGTIRITNVQFQCIEENLKLSKLTDSHWKLRSKFIIVQGGI